MKERKMCVQAHDSAYCIQRCMLNTRKMEKLENVRSGPRVRWTWTPRGHVARGSRGRTRPTCPRDVSATARRLEPRAPRTPQTWGDEVLARGAGRRETPRSAPPHETDDCAITQRDGDGRLGFGRSPSSRHRASAAPYRSPDSGRDWGSAGAGRRPGHEPSSARRGRVALGK